jgi:hypothetical protein
MAANRPSGDVPVAPTLQTNGIVFAPADGFLRLLLVNALLTIATLGLYRFWARAAEWREICARVRIDGDPLEYVGSGADGLRRFLAAAAAIAALLAVLRLAWLWLATSASWPVAVAMTLLGAAMVWPVAVMAAHERYRHRVEHLLWRGIRFGYHGTLRGYVRLWLVGVAALVASGGFAWPRIRWDLLRYRMTHTTLGDRNLACAEMPRHVRQWGRAAVGAVWLVGLAWLLPASLAPALPRPNLLVGAALLWVVLTDRRHHAQAALVAPSLGDAHLAWRGPPAIAGAGAFLYGLVLVLALLALAMVGRVVDFGAALDALAVRLDPLALQALSIGAILALLALHRVLRVGLLTSEHWRSQCGQLELRGAEALAALRQRPATAPVARTGFADAMTGGV